MFWLITLVLAAALCRKSSVLTHTDVFYSVLAITSLLYCLFSFVMSLIVWLPYLRDKFDLPIF